MQESTFDYLKGLSFCRNSSYNYYIIALFYSISIKAITLSYKASYPMSYNTITDLLTHRDSDSTVHLVVWFDVHHKIFICQRFSVVIHLAKISGVF